MLINKVQPYKKEEENRELIGIAIDQNNIIELVGAERAKEATDLYIGDTKLEEWHTLEERRNDIYRAIEDRYIKDRGVKGLLEDVEEILKTVSKEDFTDRLRENEEHIALLRKEGAKEENLVILKDLSIENYENCYNFLLYGIRVQLNGLAETKEGTAKALYLAERRALEWYVKENPSFVPVITSPTTKAFSYMDRKEIALDYMKNATIKKWDIEAFIEKYGELRQSLSINTDKLLDKAIENFTLQHHTGNTTSIDPTVVIPIREYATELGYDITEHATSTPEEAEKEKKRASYQLKNARKDIKKNKDLLYAVSLDFTLKDEKGKEILERRRRIIDEVDQDSENLVITFTLSFSRHLAEQHTLTTLPTCLRKIPATRPNAYYLGKKIAEHSFIYRNQKRGTDNLLKVSTLLGVTNLPSYEEVQRTDRGHWVERIKDRLENNLDILVEVGLLEKDGWTYAHSKGRELTKKELYNIVNNSYFDFADLYIAYKIKDKPYQQEQIEANTQKHEENRKKAHKKRAKKEG